MKLPSRTFFLSVMSFFFCQMSAYGADVPNAPALTEFGPQVIVAGETIYTNNNQQGDAQPDILIKGSAQAGTTIIVYRAGVAISQTSPAQIVAAADGKWSATVTMATGEFDVTATAANQAGTSLHSEPVHVVLDTTPPSIAVTVRQTGWRTNQYYMYGHNNMWGIISDGGSGVNWSTATIGVEDLTDSEQIAGTQEHDSAAQINFYPVGNWSSTQENAHRYRITVTASDRAGNNGTGTREYIYDSVNPSPAVITHVYDQGTWKPYTGGMTVNTNPPKLKGYVWPVDYYNQGPEACLIFDSRFYPWNRSYFTTNNGKIDINTGEFIHEWQSNQVFQQGSTTIYLYTVDSTNLYVTTGVTLNFTYGTPTPPPLPSSPDLCTLYNCSGSERQVLGSPLIPDFSGSANPSSAVQTIRLFYAPQSGDYWVRSGYNYSIEILPAGQAYQNTPGAYDPGEVYSDDNDNNQYDTGEPFLDDNSKGTSDGTSYTLTNFRGYNFITGTMYLKIAAVNQYGGSSAVSLGRFHYRTTPPVIQSTEVSPVTSPYLAASQIPTQITVNVQNIGYDWNPTFYGLNQSVSRIEILDAADTVLSSNTTSWTYLGNLRYEGVLDVTDISFTPQTLYTVRVTAQDNMTNLTVDDSYTFFIDTLPPQVVDIIPPPGSEIGRLPNFQVTLFDTSSGGLNGSGISFGNGDQAIGDPTFSQLRPLRVIAVTTAVSNTLTIEGPVLGYDGTDLTSLNQEFEVWLANDSETVGTVRISAINGVNITLSPVDCTLVNGSQYTVLQPIPYYHANNALDTLSANPIYPITRSGYYAVQVQAVDKVGNSSVTSSVYEFGDAEPIVYNPPTGGFTLSVDKPTARAGEVITVESEVITTLNGTPVSDGTLVTVSTTFGSVINADQDQFTVGIQVTTAGGKVTFQVQSTTPGTGTVHAEVAEAYSDPDPSIEIIPDYPYGTYTLTATPDQLVADGSGTVTVTGPAVTDQYGNVITDSNTPHNLFNVAAPGFSILTADAGAAAGHQITPQADGTLQVILQAGTLAQSTQIVLESVAQAGSPPAPTAAGSAGLTLLPGTPGAPIVLTATDDTLIAGSGETTLVTSQPVTDQFGNIVSDGTLITVSIAPQGAITSTDADGNAQNGIQRATTAGVITFRVDSQTASVADSTVTAQSVTGSADGTLPIHFMADIPAGIIDLTPVPAQLIANGSDVSAVTGLPIRDQYTNSVGAGVTVRVSTTAGMLRADDQSAWNAGPLDIVTQPDGSIQFELQSTVNIEQAQLTAQTVVGSAEGTAVVDFIQGPPAGQITLSSNFQETIAGSSETIIITGQVTDAYDHPVPDNTEITVDIPAGTVLTVDANLMEPGLQVKTSGGSFTARFTAEGAAVGDCTVTATSIDGTASGQITVSFIAGPPEQPFTLSANPSSILADGQTTAIITSSVILDAFGNTVADGELIRIETDAGTIITADANGATPEIEVAVDQTGAISFEVQSSTQATTAALTAQSTTGTASGSGSLTFHPGIPAQPISLTATPDELIANSGQTSQIISGVIRDVNNNPVADGTLITVSTGHGELSAQDYDDNPANGIQVAATGGIISFELLSQTTPPDRIEAGTAVVTVYGEGDPGVRAQGSVSVEYVYADPYKPIVLSAQTSPLVADGQQSTVITSEPVTDQYDNPMRNGLLVTVSTTLGHIIEDDAAGIAGNQVTTDADGRISFTLQTGTQAGSATITALSFVGTAQGQLAVPFTAGQPAGTITLHSSSDEIVLDGVSYATVTSDPVTDAYGNIVPDGTLITITTDNGTIDVTDENGSLPDTQLSATGGIISFNLVSQNAVLGTAGVSASSVQGSATGTIYLTFIPGPPSGTVTLSASPGSVVADPNSIAPVAGVTTETTITSSTITDAGGNVIADGELFTVYTSRGIITSTDADATLSGIQVAVQSGTISVQLSSYSSAIGTATVYVQSVNGTAQGSVPVSFTDTGIIDAIRIVLDQDRPQSDRYVAWNISRQVRAICTDSMGNPARFDTVTMIMTQNESGSSFTQYTGYPGSGDGSGLLFSGQTDGSGVFLVTYTTPPYTGQPDNAEDIIDAYSDQVPATEVDDRRFIVTTAVPPLFRFFSMDPVTNAGEYHPFTIEIIDEFDDHITDVQTQFPGLQVMFSSDPHSSSGEFYTYDSSSGTYTALGQNTPATLSWDQDGYATLYYSDTLAGSTTLVVADQDQATGIKSASRELIVQPGMVPTGSPQFSISAVPDQILANGTSISTISSDVVTDAYGNIVEGLIVTVSTDHGTLLAVDIDGSSANGIQVATGSDGRFSFSLRSQTSLVTANVSATTFIGGPSDTATVEFIAGAPFGVITLTPDQAEIAADPSQTVTVTSSVIRDQWGNPVAAGQHCTVSTTLGTITTADVDGNSENGVQVVADTQGKITFTVQASTQAGAATVSASSINGSASGSAGIAFVPGDPSGTIVLHADPVSVIASGPNSSVVTSEPITDGTNIIRDGELFTISSDQGSVVALDEGAQAGIQVASVNGVISFVFNPNAGKGTATIQATSINGTASGTVQVTMRSETRSTGAIPLTVSPQQLTANGTDTASVASDPLYDRYGNLLDAGIPFTVTTSRGTINDTGLQTAVITTDVAGVVRFTIKSPTSAGTASVTVQCVNNPASTGSVSIPILPDIPAGTIVLQATPSSLIANSNYTSTVKVPPSAPITDIHGNVVQDGTVVTVQTDSGHFIDDGQEVTQIQATTLNGTISVTYKATQGPGTAQIDATAGSANGSVFIDLVTGDPFYGITLNASPSSIVADGLTTSVISSGIIQDEFYNQVAQGTFLTVTTTAGVFATPDAAPGISGHQAAVSQQGTISFTLQSTTVAATASIDVRAVAGPAEGSVSVNFVPGEPAGTIVLSAAPDTLIAGSGQQSTISSSVIKDANGNPVGAGVSVTINSTEGILNGAGSSLQVTTGQNSKVQATLTADAGSSVGTAQITAQTDTGSAQTSATLEVSFVAGVPAGPISLVSQPDTIIADGVATASIASAPVTDTYGNVVPEGTLITVDTSWGSIPEPDADPVNYPDHQVAAGADGTISFTIQSETVAGIATVTADSVEGSATGSIAVTGTAGDPVELIVVLPGESYDRLQPDRTSGTAVNQTINVSFDVTVYPVDQFGNIVYDSTLEVEIDPLSTFTTISPSVVQQFDGTGGQLVFSVEDTIAGQNLHVTVTDTNDPSLTGISSGFEILAGAPVKLQVVLPGQTPVPGDSGDGLSGTPDPQNAGVSFDVIVNYVDQFYNVVTTAQGTIQLRSSGLNADRPDNLALSNGSCTFSMTERTKTTSGGSLRRLSAQLIGETVTAISDDFEVIDTMPPELVSFTINNGDLFTTSQEVVLQIDAFDAAMSDFSMQFRNENQTWAQAGAYEPYAAEKTGYQLSSVFGEKTVYVRFTDSEGNESGEFPATIVYGSPPTADAGGPYSATEGIAVLLSGAGSNDPTGLPLTYTWDLDDDGEFDDATGVDITHTWEENGTYTIKLKVENTVEQADTSTATVTVLNANPVVLVDPLTTAYEGDPVVVSGSFTDSGSLDTHTVEWNFGDSTTDTSSLSVSHSWENNGTYQVTLTVTDDDGGSDTKSTTIIIVNKEPVVTVTAQQQVNEGDTVSFSGSFTDAGIHDTHTFEWDFADGTTSDASLTPSHTYTDNGTYTVQLTVTDDSGDTGSDSIVITVDNVAPVVEAGPDTDIDEGGTVELDQATYSDAGSSDTHTVYIDWGDGDTSEYAVSNGIIAGSHRFIDYGSYTVTLTVEDDDGAAGEDSFQVNVGRVPLVLGISAGENNNAVLTFNGIAGKSYEIWYSEDSFAQFGASFNWILADTVTVIDTGTYTDQGDPSHPGPDGQIGTADDGREHPMNVAVRYYRVVEADSVNQGDPWGSQAVAFYRTVTLYEGRNFISRIGQSDMLGEVFDPAHLPGSVTAHSATKITYYLNDELQEFFVYVDGEPGIWTDGIADRGDAPVPAGCGMMVTIPGGNGQMVIPVVGVVSMDASVSIPITAGQYTIAGWPYAGDVSLDECGLIDNGFKGAMRAREADQLYFWNPQTQRYDLPVFYFTGTNEWRYYDQSPCSRTLKPGEGFLIRVQPDSACSSWNPQRPYDASTETMSP